MRKISFSKTAFKQLQSFNKKELLRLKKKIGRYSKQKDPRKFAKKLIDSKLGSYRWRVGGIRVIFDIDDKGKIIIVLVVGHRKDIYK